MGSIDSNNTARGDQAETLLLEVGQLAALIDRLRADRRRVFAPIARDGVITLGEIASVADLPVGWHDEQDAGHYRSRRSDDDTRFSHSAPAQPWKRYLQPERTLVVRTRHDGDRWSDPVQPPPPSPVAFFGIRSCDLHAVARLDVVLGEDPGYQRRRQDLIVVAVTCTTSSRSCFCASMGTGPEPDGRADIVLTEIDAGFMVRAQTPVGTELLAGLPGSRPATADERRIAAEAATAAAATQVRALPADHRERLPEAGDEKAWSSLAELCVACGNCTMVCPTCFCTTWEDRTDLSGTEAERWQRWDSCFSLDFSYMHGGGPVRASGSSRYRQWLLHKLDTWHDQFGSSGCVGCGRCIVWCPTGIDLTAAVPTPATTEAP